MMGLKEIVWEGLEWTQLAQDRIQCDGFSST